MSLNIVFAGTPAFAAEVLQALLNGPHPIQAVFTQPDRPAGRGRHLQMSAVKQLALRYDLPVYQPATLKTAAEQAALQALKPDLLVVVAYGLLLPAAVLSIPKYGCWNVHASLLPHWRGASPIQQAILHGDSLSGITIMQMDVGLDTGDIISLHPCTLELKETSESLQQRLAALAGPALLQACASLEQGNITHSKQDSILASYAPKITKDAARMNWSQTAMQLDRQIRAYNPWPVAFTEMDEHRIRVFAAEVLPEAFDAKENQLPPGTIVAATEEGIDVATLDGKLRLQEIQFPGGKRQKVAAYLHSKQAVFKPGARFSTFQP